ncbi:MULTISPECIES: hypothetical protein [Pseudomonas]|jgi:hypothetical protein|uniref:Membrane protein n=1 Tax=Pseudomonas gorinensis TaxID=3240790 RepID=A0ACA7PBN2_9PSED|nr:MULTISPECIES: hypothetical protein [Pseudomonas]AHC37400.1 membrane protein [Pseudomonas sp. TKP]MBL1309769.1 hypothetical protein [Pseudomonas sp.]MDR6578828.1 hypothetical protein [Pseudomonas extremaustralis]PMX05396.1 hypothetical protein C1Y25_28635 [Pseudomonas sp. MPBC4-3]PMX49686.1 hypothetical protein C1Y20_05465 [Pseudomonas sp. FW301-21B01]
MTAIKKLMLALTMLSATAGVQASDSAFAAFGSERTKKSSNLIHRVSFEDAGTQSAPWGQSLGLATPQAAYRVGYGRLTGEYNGTKLRPQDLQGRYDIPLSDS